VPTHVIVWNLETVPDLRGFASVNDLEGKNDDAASLAKRKTANAAVLPKSD
jgi:hypothetical protein